MKNIFNNPMFIAALGLIAASMLIWTLAKPFLNGSTLAQDDSDSDDWMDNSNEEAKAVIGKFVPKAVFIENLYWDKQPKRDPFAPDIVIKARDVKKVESQVIIKLGDKIQRRPVLSALVAGEQSKLAVIDGQIVKEGDRVAGLSVNKISSDGVWLKSSKQMYRLTLSNAAQD